jgi:uncharacterized protein HemY
MSSVYFLNKALTQSNGMAAVMLEDKGFHIKKARLDTNIKELNLWQKRNRHNALLLLIGYVLYQQKQYAEAEKVLNQAYKNNPKNSIIRQLLKTVQKKNSSEK